MKKLSIVVPVYYNEENLLSLYADMKEKVLSKLPEYNVDYEIIFVDDGSKDKSYSVMQELAKLDSKIILLKLSRNFGEHAAILAGLSRCTGDFAVRKAADLQEPSTLIIDMLEKYLEGNKVVIATRAERQEPFIQRSLSSLYATIMRKIALPNMPKGGFDSFLIDRQVIDTLVNMKEKNTSLMSQILWSGFKTGSVPYTRLKRTAGKSRWTFSKKIKLAIDSVLGFSYFPIRFITFLGFVFSFASLIALIVTIIRRVTGAIDVEGYSSLLIVMLFGFGIVMFSLGILGEYMWRMFDATRNRPPFIIDEQDDEKKDIK
ncbi:MAG: glycosyltransferase family 2 protein [Clostridia bacterium]|nr:glycosyltransferase family 2 protein [Clostridia bacterium]